MQVNPGKSGLEGGAVKDTTERRLSWDVEGTRTLCLCRSPGGKCVTGGEMLRSHRIHSHSFGGSVEG